MKYSKPEQTTSFFNGFLRGVLGVLEYFNGLLEPIGFAKSNFDALWIDPIDYQQPLRQAIQTLSAHRMDVSIYNHQLCVLPADLWRFARQSISDWKNIYLAICQECVVRDQCGGFFHSAVNAHSRSIVPVLHNKAEIATSLY